MLAGIANKRWRGYLLSIDRQVYSVVILSSVLLRTSHFRSMSLYVDYPPQLSGKCTQSYLCNKGVQAEMFISIVPRRNF